MARIISPRWKPSYARSQPPAYNDRFDIDLERWQQEMTTSDSDGERGPKATHRRVMARERYGGPSKPRTEIVEDDAYFSDSPGPARPQSSRWKSSMKKGGRSDIRDDYREMPIPMKARMRSSSSSPTKPRVWYHERPGPPSRPPSMPPIPPIPPKAVERRTRSRRLRDGRTFTTRETLNDDGLVIVNQRMDSMDLVPPPRKIKFDDAEMKKENSRKTSKLERHFKTHWWIYALVQLLVIFVGIFAGVPSFAERSVNKSTYSIESLQILNSSATGVNLKINSTLKNSGTFTPTLDSFALTLYNPSTPFNGTLAPLATILMPKIRADRNTNVLVNASAKIENSTEFKQFMKSVLLEETYTLGMNGKTVLRLGQLPKTDVVFKHDVTVKGLNGLKGLTLTGLKTLATPEANGTNVLGTANIPNPSTTTIQLGILTFNLATKNVTAGTITVLDALLLPGDNKLALVGNLNVDTLLRGLDATSKVIELRLSGNSSTFNGERLVYYEEALASNVISTSVKLSDITLNMAAA